MIPMSLLPGHIWEECTESLALRLPFADAGVIGTYGLKSLDYKARNFVRLHTDSPSEEWIRIKCERTFHPKLWRVRRDSPGQFQ